VSQSSSVTWLAVRELWISFRLIVLLVGFVGAGAAVALLTANLPLTMQRLAVGLAVSTLIAGAVAAWSLSDDRRRGRAAWLVTRSVPRPTLVTAWFIAIAAVCLPAIAVAGVLGWLAASGVSLRLDPGVYAATVGSVAADAIAAVSLGLVAAVPLPPRAAVLVTVVVAAALGTGAWLLPESRTVLPGAGVALLADLHEGSLGPADAIRAAGIGLVVSAALLLVARLLLRRSDL
jgi:hypothetical protein